MASGTLDQTILSVIQAATGTYSGRTGTIAQSLPLVTQAAAGNTIYFSLTGGALASNVLLVFQDHLQEEAVLASDLYSAILEERFTSTLVAGSTSEFEVAIYLDSSCLASSSFGSIDTKTLFSPGAVTASEELAFFFSATLTGSVLANAVVQPIRSGILHDTGYLTASQVTTAVMRHTLHDSVAASGAPQYFLGATLTNTVVASNVLTEYNVPTELLTNAAVVADVQTTLRGTFEELLTSGAAANQITFVGSVYSEMLEAIALAYGLPWARDYGALAWGLNTETTGLFTYDNYGFTSIAEYDGILYATSPEGVFALVGEDDVGRDVDAEVKTGFLDFGVPETKRLSDVFVGYTGGQLEFDVETYDGPQEVYTYAMEEREATAPRNNRLKVGRGLSSRYWRFAIRNVDGADFQIYDVAAEVGTSRRRL